MAYLPSHQELASHPKTRKAARKLGVSVPTMIGHLHLLWWWALDHALDGDLGKYDAEDLADASMWEGDPETFAKALRECGSAGGEGFLHADGKLHDWEEYGGKYGKRVDASRKAAAARWHPEDDADAMQAHSEGNADASGNASPPHDDGNAEERRGEEQDQTPLREDAPAWRQAVAQSRQSMNGKASYDLLGIYRQAGKQLLDDGHDPGSLVAMVVDYVEQLLGEPIDAKHRSMVAKTVRRNGLIALAGWDKALGATESDSPRDRLAYAQGVVNRMMTEEASG